MRGTILIVDDEPEFCRMLEADLTRRGFEVLWRTEAEQGYRAVLEHKPHVVLADVNLAGASGLDLCARIAADRPDIPVVIVTAFGSLDSAVGAIRAGAYDFITKPFDVDFLELTLGRALRLRLLKEEVKRLQSVVEASRRFEGILGESPAMRELFALIERVADSEASVLITGESGTGKEGVARAIHRRSRRGSGPFVAVNCAGVPEALLESELFGHVRGAFTDARADHSGLFVQADGGTLFLDEIGDLGLAVQPKLLRALQERSVRPLGAATEVSFNARLIAATHQDPELLVQQGRFREDLLFRVQVVRLEVPPLRDRGNDVLLLAQHFLESFAARSTRPVRGLSAPVAQRLMSYPWPGNVRELQNCIERAVALTEHDELVPEDLPERLREARRAASPAAAGGRPLLTLEEVERAHILSILEACEGNKTQAARILGVDRKTLYRKLDEYGIAPGEAGDDRRSPWQYSTVGRIAPK